MALSASRWEAIRRLDLRCSSSLVLRDESLEDESDESLEDESDDDSDDDSDDESLSLQDFLLRFLDLFLRGFRFLGSIW